MRTLSGKRGFTLIEVIIYVGIFAVLATMVAGMLWNLGSGAMANRARISVGTEADFALRKMNWAFTGLTAVSEPAAGASSSRVSVTRPGLTGNIVLELASGTILMQRGSDPAARLLSDNVRVTSLTFSHIPQIIGQPEAIAVELSIMASSSDPKVHASTTLNTRFYMRQ